MDAVSAPARKDNMPELTTKYMDLDNTCLRIVLADGTGTLLYPRDL